MDTQDLIPNLIGRIHALAAKTERKPSTISAAVLNSGAALSALESGKTITLAKYQRAVAKLDEMEAAA